MRVRCLVAACALLVCGTPLASARISAFGDNITAEATGPSGAIVTYDSGLLICTPGSGSTFPLGATTVTCVDALNNPVVSFTVNVVDTTPPALTTPGDVFATSTTGLGVPVSYTEPTATDLVDGGVPTSCSHHSGDTFPVGTTPVNCSATDSRSNSRSASFNVIVTVVDTTPPVLSGVPADISETTESPAGKVVNYTKPTATDNIDGPRPVTCSPDSGATFPVGHTTVNCSATDTHGNTGTASFNVDITLVDTTQPVFSGVADFSDTTQSPGGKVVNYPKPTATDNVDGPLPVNCVPDTGTAFTVGTTPVRCTATDSHGNSAEANFNVILTLVDTTPPVLSGVPGDIPENTQVPGGKVVSWPAPTANDNIDGPLPVTCSPPSGSNFVVGTTSVTCSATDTHGNRAEAKFKVLITLIDITKPVLSNVPADITTEANGPSGSKANFTTPTAVDNLDGPLPVSCFPLSGSTFPLGTTTVKCSATDLHGNTGSSTFKVRVVDTTPPTLNPPGDTSVYATLETGSYALDEGPIFAFVHGANAADIADPKPGITADAPVFFVVGTTVVTFTATDASGNKTSATAKLTVLPKPAPGTTPPPLPPPRDNIPPPNVTGLKAKAGNGQATIVWASSTAQDFDHYEVSRTTSLAFKATGTLVYRGTRTSFTDRGLRNGIEYRYVVASVDKAGNSSAGAAIVVVPKKSLLRIPADGARLKKIPRQFVWQRDPRAAYYNLQLYAGGALLFTGTSADPKKMLSVFPTKPLYKFKSPWTWGGRKYKLTKGLYSWFVWPGYGARADVNYGPLIGSATFQLIK
jgi:HYR domain-containing protein